MVARNWMGLNNSGLNLGASIIKITVYRLVLKNLEDFNLQASTIFVAVLNGYDCK